MDGPHKRKVRTKRKARTKRKSTASKHTPAVRYLRYELVNHATPGTETSHFFDLARDLSIINRRLYRQGRQYHVKSIRVTSTNTIAGISSAPVALQNAGRISVGVLPNGWVSQSAWTRSFKTWQRMQNEVLKQTSGNVTAKWSDFKVYLSETHRTASQTRILDNGGNNYLLGEWNYTDMVTPDGTTGADSFSLHMLGDHTGAVGAWTSVGLIKSFGDSRATVNTNVPNVPGDFSEDPLLNVFDYGTTIDEVADLIEGENDNPPYDIDDYPGADANGPKPLAILESSISDGRTSLPGFTALCGLVELEISSPVANDEYSVIFEMAPGPYRGIKAEAI